MFLRLFWLGFKNHEYRSRWNERFGIFSWSKKSKPVIWIHAVSVGEVKAATPIIHNLLSQYPQYSILVTTVTPTGFQTVRELFSNEISHLYLPYDLPVAVRKFIEKIKPELIITMETEIWPNLFHLCNEKHIPVLLVNARLSEKSAKRYRLVFGLMRETLTNISLIAAQTIRDADRFISFGINKDNVVVTGNLKFDINIPPSVSEQSESLKRYFSVNRPLWIAASTQEGEDEIILDAHLQVLKKFPEAILIIAPRHPERTGQIESLCQERDLTYIKRTAQLPFPGSCHVYLLDILGELQPNYAASQIAFVGGSLVNRGGQNTLEPASLGLPVLSGPNTYNFTEISEMLTEAGVLHYVYSSLELADKVCLLFEDANLRHNIGEKGREVIELNKGNIDRLMDLLKPYLTIDATY